MFMGIPTDDDDKLRQQLGVSAASQNMAEILALQTAQAMMMSGFVNDQVYTGNEVGGLASWLDMVESISPDERAALATLGTVAGRTPDVMVPGLTGQEKLDAEQAQEALDTAQAVGGIAGGDDFGSSAVADANAQVAQAEAALARGELLAADARALVDAYRQVIALARGSGQE